MIQYLHKKGLAPKTIHADMVATLGKDAPSYATVIRWVTEFKRSRVEHRGWVGGAAATMATPETVTKGP